MRRPPWRRWGVLLVAALLAGCATPAGPAPSPEGIAPSATPPTAPPSPTPVHATPTPQHPPPAPAPEPVVLPEGNRTFELALPARDATEHRFLVNATDRVLVTLFVRNVDPAPQGFGATVLASGPNGTRQQDTGMLPDGGAAFALRLAPLGLAAGEGPALVRVRVSAAVPVVVEGRIDVDAQVPDEGGSTVP